MKLWFLYRTNVAEQGEVHNMVLRESTEGKARTLAGNNAGPEGSTVWLDSDKSKCVHLKATGDSLLILKEVKQ